MSPHSAQCLLPFHGCKWCLCVGDVTDVPVHWGVHEDVYCAGKESTFQFLEGVLKEVINLFPSQYIHIGGDEVPTLSLSHPWLHLRRLRKLFNLLSGTWQPLSISHT